MKTLTRALALLLLLTASVMGQTYYVDSAAAAGGNGLSEQTAFDSLTDLPAVQNAGPQTIMLKAGSTFTGEQIVLTDNDTVMRYGFGANPIIDGDSSVNDCITTSGSVKNILVQDVSLTGASFHGWQLNGNAENVIVRRVHSYSNTQNGFAHDNSTGTFPVASGRIWYIDCRASDNLIDGFNNRGYARDVCIRCQTSGHTTGAQADGYTTHDSSAFELWYCSSTGDKDGAHFTHDDFGNAYCIVYGCTFTDWTERALNLSGSEIGGGVWYSTFQGDGGTTGACVNASPGFEPQVFDGCEFLGTAGGAWASFIDGAGTQPVVVRNSLLRMPDDTTSGSCYAVRQTSSGIIRIMNNTIVVPPDATETSNYFALYAAGGTTSQVLNNFFLKTDEPNAYFLRGATNWTQYDLVDGNVHVQVTTNNDSWYENAGGISFATFQADNLGVGGIASDAAGYSLADSPISAAASDLGRMEDFRIPPLSFHGYGLGVNCITAAGVSSPFATALGNFSPVVRDGSTGGTWAVGPHPQTINQNGSVTRHGNRVVFNHATISGTWSTSFKLCEGTHILGDFTKRQGITSLQLQSTGAATEVTIHAGRFGLQEEILWTGHSGTVLPIVVNFNESPLWGSPGKDIYVTFTGAGVLSGEIVSQQGSVKEPATGGRPKLEMRPTPKANATVK